MKRLVSSIMAAAMMISLGMTALPAYAQETQVSCICTEACGEDTVNSECPVCLEEPGRCIKSSEQNDTENPEAPGPTGTPEPVTTPGPVTTPEPAATPGPAKAPEKPEGISSQVTIFVSTEDELKEAVKTVNDQAPQEDPVKIVLRNDIELTNNGFVNPFYFELVSGAKMELTSEEGNTFTLEFGDAFFSGANKAVMFHLDGSSMTVSNIVLDCNSVSPGRMSTALTLGNRATLTINDGTKITGSSTSVDGNNAGVIKADGNSLVVMNGGEISGNDAQYNTIANSGIVLLYNASFEMNGGEIKENLSSADYFLTTNGYGGIIGVATIVTATMNPEGKGASFTMNGGRIANNKVPEGCGGAISACTIGRGLAPVDVIINDGIIEGNQALGGGAICLTGVTAVPTEHKCTLTINGGEIRNNRAEIAGDDAGEGGGAIVIRNDARCIMNRGLIQGNYSDLSGGAIQLFNKAVMEINGGAISQNTAEAHAGAICVAALFGKDTGEDAGSFLYLNGGKIENNVSRSVWDGDAHSDDSFAPGGGGIYLHADNRIYLSGDVEITGNRAEGYGSGGGIFGTFGAIISMEKGYVQDNYAANHGGGIYLDGTGTYEGYSHTYEEDSEGAGAFLRLKDGRISGNTADKNGGGIYIGGETIAKEDGEPDILFRGGLCLMSGGVITGNTAKDTGGGVYLENDLEDGAPNAGRFLMTDGALYGNIAGENGNTSTGAQDAGADLYAEGEKTGVTLPTAESITAYIQDDTHLYVPDADRTLWFTNWYKDYSDQDSQYGKGDPATLETGRNTGRYMTSRILDRMTYLPGQSDHDRIALILDRETSLQLKKTATGSNIPNEEYTFRVTMGNLPDIALYGTRYPVVLNGTTANASVGSLPGGQQYLIFGADGTAEVRLKAGEDLTIKGLPQGAVFQITETDAGSAKNFSASGENCGEFQAVAAQRTVSGKTQEEWKGSTVYTQALVTVNNNYPKPHTEEPSGNDPQPTPVPSAAPATALAAIPQTGDNNGTMGWIILLAAAGIGLLLMGMIYRRKENR